MSNPQKGEQRKKKDRGSRKVSTQAKDNVNFSRDNVRTIVISTVADQHTRKSSGKVSELKLPLSPKI